MKSKISKFFGVLKRFSRFLNESTKLKIYYAYIHSHLIYLNPIWSASPAYKIKELQVLQNKAVKQVYGLPPLTPSVSLYGEQVLPLNSLSDYELCLLVFKVKNNLIKISFVFTSTFEVHSYFTRMVNDLRGVYLTVELIHLILY